MKQTIDNTVFEKECAINLFNNIKTKNTKSILFTSSSIDDVYQQGTGTIFNIAKLDVNTLVINTNTSPNAKTDFSQYIIKDDVLFADCVTRMESYDYISLTDTSVVYKKKFREEIQALTNQYDLVIISCSQKNEIPLAIGLCVDDVVLFETFSKANKKDVKNIKEKFNNIGKDVLGIVMVRK